MSHRIPMGCWPAVHADLLGLLLCWLGFLACNTVHAQGEGGVKEEPASCKVPELAERLPFSACQKTLTNDVVSADLLKGRQPIAPDAIASLGPDMFGDQVNLYNGAFRFEQTDFQLPGSNALRVALDRTHVPGRKPIVRGALADWDLNTPRIEGTFSVAYGWAPAYGNAGSRCSAFGSPLSFYVGSPRDGLPLLYWAHDYWQGTNLVVPGHGSQEILARAGAYSWKPGDGTEYPLVTKDNWQISCLPSLQNAEGEGFVAVSPDGVRYRFDWMAWRPESPLRKGDSFISRREFLLMATMVSDRFGNWVRYTYDTANPMNLLSVSSSDGRSIALSYQNGRVWSASDGPPGIGDTRTWWYSYSPQGDLQNVTQPDGSSWSFNLRPLIALDVFVPPDEEAGPPCDRGPELPGDELVGEITHPSGAKGRFTSHYSINGRTNVPRVCETSNVPLLEGSPLWRKALATQMLTEKRITGPGLEDMVWTYANGGWADGGWTTCTDCPDRKVVSVKNPGGAIGRYTFGIGFGVNEGQLLRVDEGIGSDGSPALRSTVNRYRTSEGQVFLDALGYSVRLDHDHLSMKNRPQDLRVIAQQGVEFNWQVDPSAAGFDGFARPIKTFARSSLGDARTYLTRYHDNFGLWVLGQTASVDDGSNSVRIEEHDFYDNASKRWSKSFGRLTNSFDYNGDGTLSVSYDAASRPRYYQQYWRGLPQWAQFPDGQVVRGAVNNLGNLASITNEVNNTTRFEFDAMGRVSLITFPPETTFNYHQTQQRFEQVGLEQWGLPPTHWRQTITTGNAVTKRWFDGMWRLLVQQTFDANDEAGTSSFVETRYDAAGRKAFQSYPQRSLSSRNNPSTPGHEFRYDELNRVVLQLSSSEIGTLETKTEYLPGFLRRVTNPRKRATTYAYQAFDTPSEEAIKQIRAPENVIVDIDRDVFGKPKTITRSGSGNGGYKSVTRSYTYDQHQRLCKTVEPETGATVQYYDAAGNIAWRASGLTLTGNVCDWYDVPDGRKVSFGYDPRDRLISTTYGDGSPGITRRYWPDGKLQYSESAGWSWNYQYNNRRLLIQEEYSYAPVGSGRYPIDYGINAHGHVATMSYWDGNPGGLVVDYDPNALGQAKQAGRFASQVRWHPNGAIASYTLGNGITHVTTQNVRGLPERWNEVGVMNDQYWYDANGNVSYLEDQQQWQNTRGMSYDGLDRLSIANGPWGSGGFQYDTLDNITASTVGGRSLTHNIDANTNRLSSLTGGQNISLGYDANGNITQRDGQTFRFDVGNRLTEAVGKMNNIVYDAEGRRSWVTYPNGTVGGSAYSHKGQLLISGSNDGNRGTSWYVYLGGKQIAQQRNRAAGFETYYIHTDALGSPVARTNANRVESERTQYEPYGRAHSGGVPEGLELGYTGHVNDAETGLTYMQQRYYEPLAGRFLSVDPVVTDANDGHHFNRYNYAYNNPYKFNDPDGRHPVLWGIAAVVTRAAVRAVGRAIGAARAAARQKEQQENPMQRGRESEERVLQDMGKEKNTTAVEADGKKSIPDFQDSKQVGEIKDTKQVSNTEQIRTQRDAAKAEGKEHVVVTGDKTKVSAPVQENSTVIRRPDLGPK